MRKAERQCPECKGPIDWKIVRDDFGCSSANGMCKKCNILLRDREPPQISRGKRMESRGQIGNTRVKDIGALDKRITRLPLDVQIGILRERHHGKNRYLKK